MRGCSIVDQDRLRVGILILWLQLCLDIFNELLELELVSGHSKRED